jgi:hypothetical protein
MSIRSHTIPRFYLEQFANPSRREDKRGKVWVYQKGKEPQLRATNSQGYECGYFGVVRPDGSLDESLETHLARLEDRCNDILVSSKYELCDLRSLTNRNILAFYATLLFQRSTAQMTFSASNWSKLKEPYTKLASNEEYLRDTAEHFTQMTGQLITPESIRTLIQKQVERFSDKDNAKNSFLTSLLVNVEIMQGELVSKPWQIWGAPADAEFVTSDNPLVTYLPITPELWHPGHGFRQPNVVTAFPLAPSACLTMGITGREFERVTESTVMRMNDIIVRSSARFVYSKARSDSIALMMEEFGGTSVPGKNAFVGPMPDEKHVEEHMRRSMRIVKRKR